MSLLFSAERTFNNPVLFLAVGVCLPLVVLGSAGKGLGDETSQAQEPVSQASAQSSGTMEHQLKESREVLLRAVENVEKQLLSNEESNLVDWRKELHWDELVAEVRREPPHVNKLQLMRSRLFGSTIGLEHESLVALRQPFTRYIQVAKLAEAPDRQAGQRRYAYRLEPQLNPADKAVPAEGRARQVAKMTGAELELKHDSGLRQATHPNFVFLIKQEFVEGLIHSVKRQVEETNDETRLIAGASVTGPVEVKGTVRPLLKFASHQPVLEILFQGSTEAKNSTAVSGPVVSTSNGQSSIDARSTIRWDGTQLVASPAEVQCETETTPVSVRVRRNRLIPGTEGGLVDRIVEGVAMREVQQRMPVAEKESSELTKKKISAHMDEKIEKLVEMANDRIEERFHKPFIRAGMHSDLHLAKVEDYLSVGLRQTNADGSAADTPAVLGEDEGNAVLCIHESALSGFTKNLCGGAIWKEKDFAVLQTAMVGEEGAKMEVGQPSSWAVQYDWTQPMATLIQDESIEFVLRFQAVSYEGEAEICPVMIRAMYKLKPSRTTLHFVRQGDVEVTCLDANAENRKERNRIEKFLQGKFTSFFLDDFNLRGLNFPQVDPLGLVGALKIHKVRTDEGWLYLSIQKRWEKLSRFANQ